MMIRGYIPVISTLAKGLDISLNHMVTKLVRRLHVVKVTVKGGATIVANVVIITVPLGVLKVKSIKFEPRLPEWKEAAIDDLGVGIETKIALHFDKVFWLNVGFFRAVADTTYDCSYFLNFNDTTSHSVIVYMPTGQLARDIEKLYDEAAVDFTFMLFRKILPKASALIQYLISRWGTNINTLGPYSYDAVGKPNDLYERLTIPSGTSPSQETLKALVYGTESGADVTLIERGQAVEKRGCDIGALVVRRTLESESKLCFGKSGASSWNDGKLVTKIGRSGVNVMVDVDDDDDDQDPKQVVNKEEEEVLWARPDVMLAMRFNPFSVNLLLLSSFSLPSLSVSEKCRAIDKRSL
ncbi:hypothetical protein REPUB_Repub13aG0177000 [Reevesia pubescens]